MLAERDCNAQGILGCVVRWVDQGVVGAMVDSVSDVVELSKALIKSAPAMGKRMLILMKIEALVGRADMGLMDGTGSLLHAAGQTVETSCSRQKRRSK